MTKEELAAEARRIRENDAAQAILAGMRTEALEALAMANPTDADEIRAQQARVAVIDQFFDMIDVVIREGMPKHKPGIA